jgi:hypothetical protein
MHFRIDPSRGRAPGHTNNSRILGRVFHLPKKMSELGILLNLLFSFQRPTFPAPPVSRFRFVSGSGERDNKHFCSEVNKQKTLSKLFSVLPATEPSRAVLQPLWRDKSRPNRRQPYAQKLKSPRWLGHSQGSPFRPQLLASNIRQKR